MDCAGSLCTCKLFLFRYSYIKPLKSQHYLTDLMVDVKDDKLDDKICLSSFVSGSRNNYQCSITRDLYHMDFIEHALEIVSTYAIFEPGVQEKNKKWDFESSKVCKLFKN